MIDRRCFLNGGIALAATLTLPCADGRASGRARARVALESAAPSIALIDRALAGAAAFAAAARARRAPTLEFTRDVASAWMGELEPRLRAGPVTIVGYTSAPTLFCLELLARDYGARLVERADVNAGVSFVISQSPGQRAALAPAAVRAQWSDFYA